MGGARTAMRERFCRHCSNWHDINNWPRGCYVIAEHRSDTLSVPYFISDTTEPLVSMADGRTYSSKSALRSTYKASGNPDGVTYVEVGNEPIREPPKQQSTVTETLKRVKEKLSL